MTDTRAEADAELLQDRLELLRLRTLLVGALGIVLLVVSLVALLGYGSQALNLVWQWFSNSNDTLHVPSDLFKKPIDTAWARSPVLLQIGFVAIGFAGISYMTRQILSPVQVRVWFAMLLVLALCILYTQWDIGSIWHSSHRNLVKASQAKEWSRVEQLSSESGNAPGHQYVMAQVGLLKADTAMLQQHGKALVDQLDSMLLNSYDGGVGEGAGYLLIAADKFEPSVLKAIDLAVYGAAHTEIGLRSAQTTPSAKGWATVGAFLGILAALTGLAGAGALLILWRLMAKRLRWLRPWVMAL